MLGIFREEYTEEGVRHIKMSQPNYIGFEFGKSEFGHAGMPSEYSREMQYHAE
eukprot:COSAG02_NODE_3392_length_6820_cov_6.539652_1_plen_53_part_00